MRNCPNCGAPINPYKEKCEYCDTYINENYLKTFADSILMPKMVSDKDHKDNPMVEVVKWTPSPPIKTVR